MKSFLLAATSALWVSTAAAFRFEQKYLGPNNQISCPKDTVGNGGCIVRGWTDAHRVCNEIPNCAGIAQPEWGAGGANWVNHFAPDPYLLFSRDSSFHQSNDWNLYAKEWLPAFNYYLNDRKWLGDGAPDYKCPTQTIESSKTWCIVKGLSAARAICDPDPNCGGFGQAAYDQNWLNTYPDGYALFPMVCHLNGDTPQKQNWKSWTKLDKSDALTKTRPQQSASFELHQSDVKVLIKQTVNRASNNYPPWPADPEWKGQDAIANDIINQCATQNTLCMGKTSGPFEDVSFYFEGTAPSKDVLAAFIKDGLSAAQKGSRIQSEEYRERGPDGSLSNNYYRRKYLYMPKAVYGAVWVYQHDEGAKQMTGMAGGTFLLKLIKNGASEAALGCPPIVDFISAIVGFLPVVGSVMSGGLSVVCSGLSFFSSM